MASSIVLPTRLPAMRRCTPRVLRSKVPRQYLGIDGEGIGRKPHRYVLLACAGGNISRDISDKNGLSSIDCLDFILSLPGNPYTIFAFAFTYDLTKILEDLPNDKLFMLFRPETRARPKEQASRGPYPVYWEGFRLNIQGSQFIVARGKERRVIWDIFKFYQCRFTNALKDWKVGNPEEIKAIEDMKGQRGEFDWKEFPKIREYCFSECHRLAELAQKLDEAHNAVGVPLKVFHGPGSSAKALFKKHNVTILDAPAMMRDAVCKAFVAGRFENSFIGSIPEELYGWDICSAYPYEIVHLPCLEHGRWRHAKERKELDTTRYALVHYGLGKSRDRPWGPFPWRGDDGSICFPLESGGGWVYLQEYLQGERGWNNVQFREAYIYETDCVCQPFRFIIDVYRERIKIGKEGKGIVLKLMMNSGYGILAQSVGHAPFQSWLLAGMITSGTRANCLAMLNAHRNMANVLMIATDGIVTREKVKPPSAKPTGTDVLINEKGDKVDKALGSWEKKVIPQGYFLARPGIYFPLNPKEDDIKAVKARGVGKSVILRYAQEIQEQWEVIKYWDLSSPYATLKLPDIDRFCGAKTSIHVGWGILGSSRFTRANGDNNRPNYGQWIKRQVYMSFNPWPKRERVREDGSLVCRRVKGESLPYNRAVSRVENADIIAHANMLGEQPDFDVWEENLIW